MNTTDKQNELRKRIIEEMTVNYTDVLERNFDLAKAFIRIAEGGKIEVIEKDKLGAKEQILLYLIGKLYAKEAGLCDTHFVENTELVNELGIKPNSLKVRLKELRDENLIEQKGEHKKVSHAVRINMVEKILKSITDEKNKTDSKMIGKG